MKATIVVAVLLASVWAPLSAQTPVPGPAFEEVLSLRQAGSPALSPDGRTVAFTVTTADWKENRFDTEIWIAREGAPPFQLTRTEKQSSTTPRWSPDGRWLAFLADRGNKTQVWLIRPDGGEAQALTQTTEAVSDFRWAPDGRRIAFTMQEPEPDSVKQRRDRLGEFAVEGADFRLTHLWLVDVAPDPWPAPPERPCGPARAPKDSARTAAAARDLCVRAPEPVRLTSGAFTVTGFAWSPDGTRIAIEHRRDPLITSSPTTDISVLTVASKELRPLVTGPGFDGAPVWSPDSKWIVYRTTAGDTTSDFYRNGQLAKIAADGGPSVRLAADLDEDPSVVSWNATGLYLAAWHGTRRALLTVDPVSGRTSPFANAPDVIGAVSFSMDGRTMALSGQAATTLTEIYRTATSPFRPVAVTAMSRQIEGWPVGTSEVVAWNSADGERIEGVLRKPAGFDPSRRYPLLVVIHGGPTGIDIPTPVVGYVYPVTQWLARGALVLQPNYRGSAGYGERFRSLNVRNLGVGDAWDVLSGVDYLVSLGIVDTTRMGAMGWSQGGYISAYLTTTTTRFRAISVGAGISDWMTYYVNTDIHPFTRQYLRATPWDDPDIYARTSPITYVRQARTPTLIQHGELDRRVPIADAYELFQALKDRGVETQLIVYHGFGHGINKPREQLAATWHNWRWFGQHLWGDAPDSSVTGAP
ncbi:MAG: S9 family peptidase [Gemmatimonadales bacterium]